MLFAMNLGKGIITVKLYLLIVFANHLPKGDSGGFAYVRSNALSVASAIISWAVYLPLVGFKSWESLKMSLSLPFCSSSIKSISHLNLNSLCASPINVERLNIKSCHWLGLFKNFVKSSNLLATLSNLDPVPLPVDSCISLIVLNIWVANFFVLSSLSIKSVYSFASLPVDNT